VIRPQDSQGGKQDKMLGSSLPVTAPTPRNRRSSGRYALILANALRYDLECAAWERALEASARL